MWPADTDLTQLTNITSEQFFTTQSLNPMETAECSVKVTFPSGAVDRAIVALYVSVKDTAEWDTLPREFELAPPASLPGSQIINFSVFNKYEFRVGIRRDGSTNTLTSADMTVRKNGVDASA